MDGFLDGLTEEGWKRVLETVLVSVLAFGAGLLARSMARRGTVWVQDGAGRTRMSPFILLLALLCALAAAGALALGFIFPQVWLQQDEFLAWIGLVALFMALFLALLPFTRHSWEWDAASLRWQGAWRSAAIKWPDIARLGKSWDGQFFAADKSGRKIFWSTNVLQHEALSRAVAKARPDLRLPE